MAEESENQTRGRKNRKKGVSFELEVRKDLELKGYVVCKWSNNVLFTEELIPNENGYEEVTRVGKIVPAKHKFNPYMKTMALGTGFPDFIAMDLSELYSTTNLYQVFGVEAKSNGYLTKEEKEKLNWYLRNEIFSQILIASKKDGLIIYKTYKEQ